MHKFPLDKFNKPKRVSKRLIIHSDLKSDEALAVNSKPCSVLVPKQDLWSGWARLGRTLHHIVNPTLYPRWFRHSKGCQRHYIYIYRMWQTSEMQKKSHCSPPLAGIHFASGSKYTTNIRGVYWYVGFISSFLVGRFCVCSTSLQQIQLKHSNNEIKLQYPQKPRPTPKNLALRKWYFLLSPFYSVIRILSWMMFLVCLEDQPRTWMRG